MKPTRKTLLSMLFTACGLVSVSQTMADEKVTFDDNIKPLFAQRCAACHNPNKKSGDLDVTNFTALMQGGGSGAVIEPGDSSSSYLYALVTHSDSPEMPPDSDRIPDPEIQLLQQWIDGGALENKSSKAILPKKKKMAVVDFDPSQRPEKIPQPCRLSIEADVVPHRQPIVTAMATSPWAPVAAIAGAQQVVLYDTQSLKLLGVLAFPEGQINVLKFSRNGSLLLAAGGRAAANGVAIAWDIETGERVIEIKGEMDAVLAADINKDHSLIALGGPQKLVKIFDTETGKVKFEMKKHTDWVQAIEFSPDGVLLATGDRAGGVLVWEAMTGREYLDLRDHKAAITDLSWRIDSNILATASEDTTIKLWEMENGGKTKDWGAHGGGTLDIEFTRDSRIVSCGRDNQCKVFDQNGGQQKAYPVQQYATAVTHCDETNRLIVCNFDAAVTVFNLADDANLGPLLQNPAPLEQRLAQAQSQFNEVKTQYDAAAAQAAAAKESLDTKTAEWTAANTKLTQLTSQLAELDAKIQQYQADLQSRQTQMQNATQVIEQLTPGLANIGQAIEAIDRAQSTMKSEQLQSSRNQLVQLKQEQETQLNTNNQLVQTLKPEIETLQTTMQTSMAMQGEMKNQLTQTTQLVNQMKPVLEQMTQDHQAKAQAVASLQPTLEQRQQQMQWISSAVEFEKTEQQILSQLADAWSQVEQQADAIGTAQQQVAADSAAVHAQQAEITKHQDQIDQWNKMVQEKDQQKVTWVAQMTTLQQQASQKNAENENLTATGVKLQESLAALLSALELDAEDEALKASKANLESVIQQRQQQADLLTTQLAELKQQMDALSGQIAAADTEIAALKQQVQDTMPMVEQAMAALKPLVEKRDQTQQALDAAKLQLDTLTASHAAIRDQLMQLREVAPAQPVASTD